VSAWRRASGAVELFEGFDLFVLPAVMRESLRAFERVRDPAAKPTAGLSAATW
jgi:hypothetical protein